MNRLMTFGQDVVWRQYVVRQANLPAGGRLLDIATGTGDIADEGQRQVPDLRAVGGDFTIEMMQAGKRLPGREALRWVAADTLALPFPDATFDAVTSGFLMRNVIDVAGAVSYTHLDVYKRQASRYLSSRSARHGAPWLVVARRGHP